MNEKKPPNPWVATKQYIEATAELDQATGSDQVGQAVSKIKVGLAALAVILYRKIRGKSDA